MPTEIETRRLRLKPLRGSDLDAVHALWTDPDVRRYLWDDIVITRDRAKEQITRSNAFFKSHGCGLWGLTLRAAGVVGAGKARPVAMIGFCGILPIEDATKVELLYGLARNYWGRGLATEASKAVLGFGFESRGFPQILARTDFPNNASVRVMERLGMKFRECGLVDGFDTLSYAITREGFRERFGSAAGY